MHAVTRCQKYAFTTLKCSRWSPMQMQIIASASPRCTMIAPRRMVADHRTLRLLLSYPATLHDLQYFAPAIFGSADRFIIHHSAPTPALICKPSVFLDTHFDRRTSGSGWASPAPVVINFPRVACGTRAFFPSGSNLRALIFARPRYRLHETGWFCRQTRQFIDIGIKVSNRGVANAGIHCRFRDRRSDFDNQTRVKRFRTNAPPSSGPDRHSLWPPHLPVRRAPARQSHGIAASSSSSLR